MLKNKITNENLGFFSEEDIAFAEEMLETNESFIDSTGEDLNFLPQQSGKEITLKTNKIITSNYVTVGEKMLYSVSDLSLFSQKLFYATISKIRKGDNEFYENIFTVKEIVDKFKIDRSHAYKELHKATLELYKEANFFVWDEKTKSLTAIQMFDEMELIDGKSAIKLCLSQKVAKYFLNLQNNFYKVPLDYLFKLASQNSMKLFHILYGQYYYYINYYLPKVQQNKSKSKDVKEPVKLIIPYEQLRAMFEGKKYSTYLNTSKMGKDKYPTFNSFYNNILKFALPDINKLEILHIEFSKIYSKKQVFFENNYQKGFTPLEFENVNYCRKVSYLEFTITEGSKYEEEEKALSDSRVKDELLYNIQRFFKLRFDINEGYVARLQKKYGYSPEELMLSAISMQSVLNLSSRGVWIYTEDKNNWLDVPYRIEHYIKEYLKIALPNLGLYFDENDTTLRPKQMIIREPAGFLKSTLEDKWYLTTIDYINSQSKLASFCDNKKDWGTENYYTKSFYENEEFGEKFNTYIKKAISSQKSTTKEKANQILKDYDLIQKVFNHCLYSATTTNSNYRWKEYFYNGLNELDVYWKVKKYDQHPEMQQSIRKTVDRILDERNLND